MSVRLNSTTDVVKGMPVINNTAGCPGYLMDTDDSVNSGSFSICLYWYQDANPNSAGNERVLFEWHDGANCCHVITADCGSTGAYNITFRWRMGTAKTCVGKAIVSLGQRYPGNCWSIICSFRKDTTFNLSDVGFIVKRVGAAASVMTVTRFAKNDASQADLTDSATVVTSLANTKPSVCSYGKDLSGYFGSATGVGVAVIRNDVVRDGTSGTVDASLIYDRHEPLQAFFYAPTKVIYGVNHLLQGNPWNGGDLRVGAAVTNIGVFDIFHGTQKGYFGRSSSPAPTVVGAPTNVDAYALGSVVPSYVNRNYNPSFNDSLLPAANHGYRSSPQGTPSMRLVTFADECQTLQFSRRWKVMVTANSRAVYGGAYRNLVKTVAGTITTVSTSHNMNDAGWLGLVGPDNVVGYINHPVVLGVDGIAAGSSEVTRTGDRAFGLDIPSSGASDLPLIADNAETLSTVATGTQACGHGSLSMLWFGARSGGPSYNSTNFEFAGAGNPRRLLPGYSYRILCQPINSFAHDQPLTMKIRMLDIPSGSGLARYRKRGATSQGGTDTLGASDGASPPTMGSSGSAVKQITAVTGTFTWNTSTDLLPATRYSLTVDDSNNAYSAYVAGDLIELVTAGGAARVSDIAGLPDVSIIHTITGKGTATCVITPYNRFRVNGGTTAPTTADYVKLRSAIDAIKTVQVDFAAGETASNIWRGLDVKAANDGKSGLIILGIDFYHPTKAGLIPCRCSYSGVGYRYQMARLHQTVHATDGLTWAQRCYAEMNPDVVIMSTANQGDGNSVSGTYALQYYDWLAGQPGRGELLTYATGPEVTVDGTATPNLVPSDHTHLFHSIFEYIASVRSGVVNTAYAYSPESAVENIVRYCTLAGFLTEECSESATHPTGTLDLLKCVQQITRLAREQQIGGTKVLQNNALVGLGLG